MATQETRLQALIRGPKQTFKKNPLAYLFVLPTIVYLIFLWWIPFLWGVRMSFFRWPLFGEPTYIGLENYIGLVTWDVFYISLKATLIYGLQTIPQMIIGVGAALLIWNQKRFVGLASLAFLAPYIFPPLIIGTLWAFLLQPDLGPIFDYLTRFGVLGQPIYWSVNGDTALAIITLVGTWTFWPLVFLLVISSLRGIPSSHIEAAKVYGANRWQRFRHVILPEIKTAILIALILRIIWNLGKIEQPLQITRGGPGWQTSVLGILIYRLAWLRDQLGMAFAGGLILAVISLLFVSGFIYMFERSSGEVKME